MHCPYFTNCFDNNIKNKYDLTAQELEHYQSNFIKCFSLSYPSAIKY